MAQETIQFTGDFSALESGLDAIEARAKKGISVAITGTGGDGTTATPTAGAAPGPIAPTPPETPAPGFGATAIAPAPGATTTTEALQQAAKVAAAHGDRASAQVFSQQAQAVAGGQTFATSFAGYSASGISTSRTSSDTTPTPVPQVMGTAATANSPAASTSSHPISSPANQAVQAALSQIAQMQTAAQNAVTQVAQATQAASQAAAQATGATTGQAGGSPAAWGGLPVGAASPNIAYFLAQQAQQQAMQPQPVQPVTPPVPQLPPAPQNPPGGGGRIGGLRLGRIGQLATIGFAALEVGRAAKGYANYSSAMALAGNDQQAQYEAEQGLQQAVESTPFLGPLIGGITDFANPASLASKLAFQGAHARDAQSQAILLARTGNVEAARSAALAGSSLNSGFETRRLSAGYEFDRAKSEATQRRTDAAAPDLATENNLAATLLSTREDRVSKFFQAKYGSVDRSGSYGERSTEAERLRIQDQKSVDQLRGENAKRRDGAFADAVGSSQKVLDSQNVQISRDESAYGAQVRGQITATTARTNNDQYGAKIAEIAWDTIAKAIVAPSSQKKAVFDAGMAMGREIYVSTKRDIDSQVAEIGSQARSRELAIAGFNYASQRADIIGQRDQKLLALQGSTAPDADKLRAAITDSANQQLEQAGNSEQQRQILAAGNIASELASLRRDQPGAQIAQLEAGFNARNVGRSNFSPASISDRLSTWLQEQQVRQQRADQVAQIALRQGTQNQQLDALLNRDPTGAEVAGIVGSAREQALSLRQRGFGPQANAALRLGQKQLDLTAQNYGDAFRGEELDLRAFAINNPRDQENPSKVFGEIAAGKADLNKDGDQDTHKDAAGSIPDWARSLVGEFATAVAEAIGAIIAK